MDGGNPEIELNLLLRAAEVKAGKKSIAELFDMVRDPKVAAIAARPEYLAVQEMANDDGDCVASVIATCSIQACHELMENAGRLKRAEDLLNLRDRYGRNVVRQSIDEKMRRFYKTEDARPAATPKKNDAALTIGSAHAGCGSRVR